MPIAYPWSPTLASTPRFTSLSPHVLLAYDQACRAAAREVHSDNLPDLSSDFALIRRFDHYFQELHGEGRPDPNVEFDDDWLYFIVDFQGWSHRQIPLHLVRRYYLLFASSVSVEGQSNVVLFHRWEPLDNFSATQPLSPAIMEDVKESSVVREIGEIRELHKYNHAPVDGSHFDLEGRPFYLACPPDSSRRDNRGELQHAIEPSLRQWLRQMADDRSRYTPSPSDNSGRGSRTSHPVSRLSSGRRSRGRSASPRQRTYPCCRESSPLDSTALRQRAVARLCECSAVITHADTVWTMPSDLGWNLAFLNRSFLLFPDSRTLTRLHYWAICDSNVMDVRSLLDLAIVRNMRFVMAMKLSDLRIFRPSAAPGLSELTKRTYEAGFQEEHLRDINGGAAFRDQYMGKLADILR